MRLEPPGPHVPTGRPAHRIAIPVDSPSSTASALRRWSGSDLDPVAATGLAATAAALVVAGASVGDVFVLAVLLGLAALDVSTGLVAVLAAVATLLRWGSTSLPAVAGAQAVLGPAGWVGPVAGATSSWLAAAALVVVAPRSPAAAVAFGLAAADLVAGAAPPDHLVVRVVVSIVAVGLALLLGDRLPRAAATGVALVAVVAACVGAGLA